MDGRTLEKLELPKINYQDNWSLKYQEAVFRKKAEKEKNGDFEKHNPHLKTVEQTIQCIAFSDDGLLLMAVVREQLKKQWKEKG